MFRKLLGTMLVLGALAGCSSRMGECQSDGDCQRFGEQALCEPATKQCFVRDAGVEPEVDGGTCAFQCEEYEACTSSSCVSRYAGLSFVTPTSGAVFDGGTAGVPVTARLQRVPGYASTTTFPSTLTFSASGPDGGPGGTFAAVSPSDDGSYTTEWTPPVAEGEFVLTAAYPVAGGPTGTVSVRVDKLPPTLNVTVAAATPPAAANGFTYEDSQQPQSYRRDETARVTVDSSSADLDPASIQFVVQGIGGTDITDLPLVDCAPLTAPFCKTVDVPLWRPALNAFRGNFTVRVTVKDQVGNPVTVTRTIPVTRWRWAFEGASGNIRSSPAVGETGTVYFGTSDSNGKVFALTPGGAKKWPTDVSLGAVAGSVAVGRPRADNEEYVFVGATSSGATQFYALRGSDGGQHSRCPETAGGFGSALFESSFAVGSSGSPEYETAAAVFNSAAAGRIVVLRPDEALEADRCTSYTNTSGANSVPFTTPGAALVRSDDDLFFGTSTGTLTSYAIGSTTVTTGWPVNTSFAPHGLALFGGNLYGGTGDRPDNGGLFRLPQAGGTVSYLYPESSTSRVFNLAVGSGNIAFFGAEAGTRSDLTRLDLATLAPNTPEVGAGGRAAPVVGRNGALYTAADNGDVTAWTADTLTSRWTVSLGAGAPDASPTLDCLREGGSTVPANTLGVLYVPAASKLYALIVDSPGLDTTAPWPKYQHDARNSGNPATPITSCQ